MENVENKQKSNRFWNIFINFRTQTCVNIEFYALMRALLSLVRNIPQQSIDKKSCFQPVFKSEQIANAGKTAVWVLGNLTKNYLKFVVRARLRSFAFVNSWKCFKICLIFVRFQHFPSFFSSKKCVFKPYYPVKRATTLRDIESDEQWNL